MFKWPSQKQRSSKSPQKSEYKRTESDELLSTFMDETDKNEYEIEDSDHNPDDQYSEGELNDILEESSEQRKKKPHLTRTDFMLSKKTSPSEKRSVGNRSIDGSSSKIETPPVVSKFLSPHQDKRPRSALDSLDEEYDRKSPPKVKRGFTPKKIVLPAANTSNDLKPETKSPDLFEDNNEIKSSDDSVYDTANDESHYEEKVAKDTSDERENTAMSEDMFETSENDSKMDFTDEDDVPEPKVEQVKEEKKTKLSGSERQRTTFKNYFISPKRPTASKPGSAQTADDLKESSNSNSGKSPKSGNNFSIFIAYRGDDDSHSETKEESQKEPTEVEGESLLTDDDSDTEVNVETNHLKSLNITSDKTSTSIQID